MPQAPDPAAEAHWRHLLSSFPSSGLGARAFCARHGVPLSGFYARRRAAVAAAAPPPAGPLFVPVRVAAPAAPPPPPEGRIELLLEGGVTVRLCGDVQPARLAAVLGVLGARGGGPC